MAKAKGTKKAPKKSQEELENDQIMQNAVVPTKEDEESKMTNENKETPKAEEKQVDEQQITKVFSRENVDLTESVNMMFEGTELTNETKAKIQTVFESAFIVKLNEELEKVESEAREAIEVRVGLAEAALEQKADEYMDYVIKEWTNENKLAIETGIRQERMEGFFKKFLGLCEEFNIDVPKEKLDELDAAKKVIESKDAEINALNTKLMESDKATLLLKKDKAIEKLCEGLTMTQTDKLKKLVAEVDAKSLEMFEEKAKILRDSIFTEEKPVDNKGAKVVTKPSTQAPGMTKLLNGLKNQ